MGEYSVFAQYYDRLTGNVSYPVRAEYFLRLIDHFGGQRGILLDLACGTGSLSVEFARAGLEVIGVDQSGEMLAEAQSKAFSAGQDILFLCQRMQDLTCGTVDVCVCALDSINHLTELEQVAGVHRVSLFLNPGGLFLFDLNTPYKHREVLGQNTFVYDEEEVYCVWQNFMRNRPALLKFSWTLRMTRTAAHIIEIPRVFGAGLCARAIVRMLERAGLSLAGYYASDSFGAPDDKTQRIVYAARKAGK
ncbi:MAG: class I SAM-dependent DNA methyltransferase [Oscillospiraceae bacterium]